jgi:hypothetical protein
MSFLLGGVDAGAVLRTVPDLLSSGGGVQLVKDNSNPQTRARLT